MIDILGWTLFALTLCSLGIVLWNTSRKWPRPQPLSELMDSPELAGQVAILIPARNEERNLPRLIDSLLQQGGVVQSITVLDDKSTDRTAQIVRDYAVRDSRVHLISGAALPDGWCGKCWACHQLSQQAAAPWLLYLDADTVLQPGAVAAMLDSARRNNATLQSFWPGHELDSLAEQACMPMLNYTVFSMFPVPLQFLRPADPSLGIAHGTSMLFDTAAYRRLGGHSAVRGSLFEDARLAQHWRRSGERSFCVDGQDLIRVRMYTGFREIWRGFEKNLYPCCGTQLRFWTWIGLRFICFQLPLVLAPFYALYGTPHLSFWLAFAVVMLQRLLLTGYFRQAWWPVLLHPLTEAGVLAVSLSSWWRITTGIGVYWKGRVYTQADEEVLEADLDLEALLSEPEPELSTTE